MTDEIITMIKEAEAEGAALKEAATLSASKTVLEAEAVADKKAEDSENFCRAYRETQVKLAEAEAQKAYDSTLETSLKNAKAYAQKALEKADDEVAKIVGRIVSGNR